MRHPLASFVVLLAFVPCLTAAQTITPTERGAVAETDRYRAEFRDGLLVSFVNKLTAEEYMSQQAKTEQLLPHLPSGLGTQNTNAEREAAG